MSFQAYLDTIEDKTGKTPAVLLTEATVKGFGPATKAAEVKEWLKTEYGLGHGHAMAFYYVLKNGTTIGEKFVGATGAHRDESSTLRLDGKAHRSQPMP